MSIFKKIFKRPSLRERVATLEKAVATLEKAVAELSKKTISQTTTEKDEPPTPTQILDEWFNGKEDDE